MYKIDTPKKLKVFLILFSKIILIKFFTNKKRKMDSGNKLKKEKKHSSKLIVQGFENWSPSEEEEKKSIN